MYKLGKNSGQFQVICETSQLFQKCQIRSRTTIARQTQLRNDENSK